MVARQAPAAPDATGHRRAAHGQLARQHQTPRWRLMLSRIASSRPVALPIALIAIGLLVFAALNVRSTGWA